MIYLKDLEVSTFKPSVINKFEFRLFMTLNIVRFELQATNSISDETADVLSYLFVFNTFEYYYRDYPDIYAKCSALFKGLIEYNEELMNFEQSQEIGREPINWSKYFNGKVDELLG